MPISLTPQGIVIDNQPVIILSSSLFYFRLPRAEWSDRMLKLRRAGYNAIDVYFPWNYHELSEGTWNFHSERDVAEFLHQAQAAGLWVIARPGPYICSEWDGGGLPAYLLTKTGVRLRDNDPRFLRYVGRWFDHILPILEPFQITRGGSIIAVQLENELDFYDTQDRGDYIEVLRDIARDSGIRVPLIACAGQGDLRGASGHVSGVVPTCNIYNDNFDPGVEQRAYHFFTHLQEHGHPLCVTETNRSHFFLRRLFSAGAKWIGPYLQTGGTNFGFTQAVNNWGQPLAFLASDYDFGGMIASDGSLRQDYREAVLFTREIAAYGAGLAQARPVRLPAGTVQGDLALAEDGPYGLELADGGLLVALPGLAARSTLVTLHLNDLTFPCHTTLAVVRGRCPLLPVQIDLRRWGFDGRLVYATAELAAAVPATSEPVPNKPDESGLALLFFADSEAEGEIALDLPGEVTIDSEGMQIFRADQQIVLTFQTGGPVQAKAHLTMADGRVLVITGLAREDALRALLPPAGAPVGAQPAPKAPPAITWHSQPLGLNDPEAEFRPAEAEGRALSLEEMGILRGYGWYRGQVSGLAGEKVLGYLLQNAADVLSLYADGQYLGTVTPGGGSAYLGADGLVNADHVDLLVRAEIWGHSNFDDPRLPALRLNALRGLNGLIAVLRERSLTSNWAIHQMDEAENKDLYTAPGLTTEDWPLVNFAAWLTTQTPNRICYRKHISLETGPVDSWVLTFPDLTRSVEVSINGSPFVYVTPLDPFVDLTTYVQPGRPLELVVYGEQEYHGQLAGQVVLLEGKRARGWQVSGLDETGLWNALSAAVQPGAPAATLPIQVPPGEMALLWAELPVLETSLPLNCQGRSAKISLFFNGHLVGRCWLDPIGGFPRGFPRITGGATDRAYLPASWSEETSNRLLALVEAVRPDQPGEVTAIVPFTSPEGEARASG